MTSLSRQGPLTGITALSPDLIGKRLEFLKQFSPSVRRIAAIGNQSHPGVATERREAESTAARLGLQIRHVSVGGVDDFGAAFEAIAHDGTDGLLSFPDNLITTRRAHC